jgi:hypothetical protein
MPSAKEAAAAATGIVKEMIKHGEAELTVNLVAHADDPKFSMHPPSCRVTVTVTDPKNPGKTVEQATADIPTATPPYTHTFRIPVETVVNWFKRWRKGEESPSFDVSIVAKPINGFEDKYDPDTAISGMQIKPGKVELRNIALKPKNRGGQKGKDDGSSDKRSD